LTVQPGLLRPKPASERENLVAGRLVFWDLVATRNAFPFSSLMPTLNFPEKTERRQASIELMTAGRFSDANRSFQSCRN
jgi:hypothetical protein